MLENIIIFTFSNFGLVMLFLAIILIATESALKKTFNAEIIYRWIALLPLGITGLYSFIMHAFFPDFTAAQIGWTNNPFQFEVAMANLGFAVIAILSFNASFGFRLATVIGNTCWLGGDAIGHIYQIMKYKNFSVGNAGSWFWLDMLVPLILIICVMNMKKNRK